MLLTGALARCAVRGAARCSTHAAPALRFVTRWESTLRLVPPADDAAREVPTPLLFLASPQWSGSAPAETEFRPLIQHLQGQGYASLLLDLDVPELMVGARLRPSEVIGKLEQETVRMLRNPPPDVGPMPYPPVMVAGGPVCAVAEAYASSHPLRALQLVNPPLSMARAAQRFPAQFDANEPVPEFDFEARFPVRVVWTEDEMVWQTAQNVPWYEVHRIEHQREELADESLDRYVWPSMAEGAAEMQQWLEAEAGVYVQGTDEDLG